MASRHDRHEEFDPTCGECVQGAASEAFDHTQGQQSSVSCPACGHEFDPRERGGSVRVTEAADLDAEYACPLCGAVPVPAVDAAGKTAWRVDHGTSHWRVTEADASKPYGDVAYADPGYQDDGKKRYPIDTADHVRSAWSYINQAKNAGKYSAADLKKVKAKIMAAAKKLGVEISEQSSEAHINGSMSFDDVKEAVRQALEGLIRSENGMSYCWVYVADLTSTDVVYAFEGDDLWQRPYTIDDYGLVTLGDPSPVVKTYAPAPGASDGGSDGEDGMAAAEAGAFDASKHPRGKKGDPNGGRFVSLSYDSSKKTGTGYGKKAGDPRVKELQRALNRLGMTDGKGHKLAVDGKLGPLTTSSIKKAQRALGLPANGKVTPDLLAKLKSAKRLTKPKVTAKPGPAGPKSKAGMAKKTVVNKAPAKKAVVEAATEERARMVGRILEAKGEDEAGNRIFGVRIIAYGDSKNRRRYPEAVMREAAPMYEGAKAYDHHRTDEELKTSTINGLIGSYRNVEASGEGIEADLHLLPSATHAAEALDASIAAQEAGLPPLIGLSHDVMARFKSVTEGGQQVQEATAITAVNSADLVADPAAGGMATRMVAGGTDGTGTEPAENEEDDVPPTKDDILGALAEATDEELAAVGLSRASEAGDDDQDEGGERETESREEETRETEAGQPKTSFLVGLMVREKLKAAGLPEAVIEGVTAALPDRVVEADIDRQIANLKTSMGMIERAGLAPTVASTKVTQESLDKKAKALDAMFSSNFTEGYRSFRQAFEDFTGRRPRAFDEDYNRIILRESMGSFDSGVRASESADSTTWNLVLGDSITRRMVAEYGQPSLQTWRAVVSSIVPVNDFRTQRIDRIGGYGTLPIVNQGAPYQPLTTPGNEEVTYALAKRGGTEDITLEMIANDDIRAISKIPQKLGLAAAQTLFRFVWDMLNPGSNPTIYDGNGLWTSHNNASTNALSQSAVSTGRRMMRNQTAFGDTSNVLSFVPRTLIVCNTLEELGYQLTKSAVAIPSTPAGPSDTPNIHSGLDLIVVDYWSTTTGWELVADPAMCPTIELGFYNGRQEPELFTQSDPSVGSNFDADKITYKIRHPYSGAVLDYRGFYRGNT